MGKRRLIPGKASELMTAMCDGLEFALNAEKCEVSMGTWGAYFETSKGWNEEGDDIICVGCASAYTVLARANVFAAPWENIVGYFINRSREFNVNMLDGILEGYHITDLDDLDKIEHIVDAMRSGNLTSLCEHYNLPIDKVDSIVEENDGFATTCDFPFLTTDVRTAQLDNTMKDYEATPLPWGIKKVKQFVKATRDIFIPGLIELEGRLQK